MTKTKWHVKLEEEELNKLAEDMQLHALHSVLVSGKWLYVQRKTVDLERGSWFSGKEVILLTFLEKHNGTGFKTIRIPVEQIQAISLAP